MSGFVAPLQPDPSIDIHLALVQFQSVVSLNFPTCMFLGQ